MPEPIVAPTEEQPKAGTHPNNLTNEQLEKMLGAEPEVATPPAEEESKETEEGSTAGPTEEKKETVEGLFTKSGEKFEEVKWEDLEIPLKYKGEILEKPYKDVINLAQKGLDAETKYQAVRDIKAENEYFHSNYQKLVEKQAVTLARQMFQAEIERLEAETTGEEAVDNKSKAALARERLRETELETLREEIRAIKEGEGQKSKEAQKAETSRVVYQIRDELFSKVESRFAGDKESFSAFKDLVDSDINNKVKARVSETGKIVSYEDFREIGDNAIRERLKHKLFNKTQTPKPLPKAGPVASGNGSASLGTPKVSNKKLLTLEGIKSLSNEEIDRLGR